MIENTVQTLIDSVKDLTGQTNLSNAKAIRALNFAVDDWSLQTILASGKWRRDSTNHGNVSRITATLPANQTKLSLPTDMIAIRQVEILVEGTYQILHPTDIKDASEPLDAIHQGAGLPERYDYDSNHLYFYPVSDSARTVRITYSRNHPRFSADNLTQDTGVLSIDEEYVVLYAADFIGIGVSDTARAAVAQKLAGKRADMRQSFAGFDQDTPRRMRPKADGAFSSNSFRR